MSFSSSCSYHSLLIPSNLFDRPHPLSKPCAGFVLSLSFSLSFSCQHSPVPKLWEEAHISPRTYSWLVMVHHQPANQNCILHEHHFPLLWISSAILLLLIGLTTSFCDSSQSDLVLRALSSSTFSSHSSPSSLGIFKDHENSLGNSSLCLLPFKQLLTMQGPSLLHYSNLVSLKALSDRFCWEPFENTKTLHQLDHPYSQISHPFKELMKVSKTVLTFTEAMLIQK